VPSLVINSHSIGYG